MNILQNNIPIYNQLQYKGASDIQQLAVVYLSASFHLQPHIVYLILLFL